MARHLTFVLLALVGCGGTPKQSASAAGSDATSDAPACEPGRCLDDIARVLDKHHAETHACYDKSSKRLAGKLIMNFTIDPDGNVTETSQGMRDDQISDEAVVTCVGDAIKKVKFAKSAHGKTTRAYHRFEFAGR